MVTASCNGAVTLLAVFLAVAVMATAPVPGGAAKLKPVVSAIIDSAPCPDQVIPAGAIGLHN
jgi:hypothetical protein